MVHGLELPISAAVCDEKLRIAMAEQIVLRQPVHQHHILRYAFQAFLFQSPYNLQNSQHQTFIITNRTILGKKIDIFDLFLEVTASR